MEPQLITRYGAYGILYKQDTILLSKKKSGPYKGLWGLPGGSIEFGESPEEALKREFLEEVALQVGDLELLSIATAKGNYVKPTGEPYKFHHIGIIYFVKKSSEAPNHTPEEELCWMNVEKIDLNQLTPFAKYALDNH